MKKSNLFLSIAFALAVPAGAQAAAFSVDGLQIRQNTVNNHAFADSHPNGDFSATAPPGGVATTVSSTVTWINLDLDGIGGSDDSITFNVDARSNTANNVSWGGVGWGAAAAFGGTDSLTFTLSSAVVAGGSAVGGTLVFDGFTGGGALFYAGADPGEFDGNMDINGQNVSRVWPVAAGFQSFDEKVDFAAIASVTFDNPTVNTTVGFAGMQARSLDLDFTYTPVPEPSALALLGFAGLALIRRRR